MGAWASLLCNKERGRMKRLSMDKYRKRLPVLLVTAAAGYPRDEPIQCPRGVFLYLSMKSSFCCHSSETQAWKRSLKDSSFR